MIATTNNPDQQVSVPTYWFPPAATVAPRTPAQKALILAHLTVLLASLDKEEVRQHGNT